MKNIGSFYTFYLPGILISTLTTIMLMGFIPDDVYYIVNFYILYSTYTTIFTFGFQDGMFLRYRKKGIDENSLMIKKELKFMILFQIFVYFALLLCIQFIDTEYTRFAVIAMLPTNIISIVRGILQATNKTTAMAIMDLILRLGMFLTLLIVALSGNGYKQFIALDIIVKFGLMFLFIGYALLILKKNKVTKENGEPYKQRIIGNFKTGFPLLVGNWILMLILSLDRIFAAQLQMSNPELLGFYLKSLTLMNIFITLLIPLRTIFLSTVEKSINKVQIQSLTKLLSVLGIFITSCYMLIVFPMIKHFGLFADMIDSFEFLLYLFMIIPIAMNIQIQYINLIIIKKHKIFPFLNILVFCLFGFIYFLLLNYLVFDFSAIILGVIINYFIMFILYGIFLLDIKVVTKNVLFLCIWILFYSLALINSIMFYVYIILFMIGIFVVYKKRKEFYFILKR